MTDEAEIVWRLCNEHYTQARHHETLRERMTSVFSGIAAASLAFAAQGGLQANDIALGILVIAVGSFGAVFSAKHVERAQCHKARARAYRQRLNEILPGAQLEETFKNADLKHRERYPQLNRLRIQHFWVGVHIVIALIGVLVTCMILTRW